jgi:hypothetical protein
MTTTQSPPLAPTPNQNPAQQPELIPGLSNEQLHKDGNLLTIPETTTEVETRAVSASYRSANRMPADTEKDPNPNASKLMDQGKTFVLATSIPLPGQRRIRSRQDVRKATQQAVEGDVYFQEDTFSKDSFDDLDSFIQGELENERGVDADIAQTVETKVVHTNGTSKVWANTGIWVKSGDTTVFHNGTADAAVEVDVQAGDKVLFVSSDQALLELPSAASTPEEKVNELLEKSKTEALDEITKKNSASVYDYPVEAAIFEIGEVQSTRRQRAGNWIDKKLAKALIKAQNSPSILNGYKLETVPENADIAATLAIHKENYVRLSARYGRHTLTPVMRKKLNEAREAYLSTFSEWQEANVPEADRETNNVDEFIGAQEAINVAMLEQTENKRLKSFYENAWTKRGKIFKGVVSAAIGVPVALAVTGAASAVAAPVLAGALGARLARRMVTGKFKKEANAEAVAHKKHDARKKVIGEGTTELTAEDLQKAFRNGEKSDRKDSWKTVAKMGALALTPFIVRKGLDLLDTGDLPQTAFGSRLPWADDEATAEAKDQFDSFTDQQKEAFGRMVSNTEEFDQYAQNQQNLIEFNKIITENNWTQQQGIDVLRVASERARLIAEGMTEEDADAEMKKRFALL